MLKGITYVVKSHKEYGYHFYILTPVLHEAIGPASFKLGAEIEVKTDLSLGTMHLPPSRHRKYPYWNYKQDGTAENIYVDEDDTVFQQIIKAMSPYFRKEPTEENILALDAYPPQASGPNFSTSGLQQQRQQPNRTLTTEQIDKAVDVILNHSNSYFESARNDLVFGLAGHSFHNLISESSTTKLVGKLCKQAKDEETDERLDVVTETYKKRKTGKPIRGISQLKYLVAKYNNENEVRVNEIIFVDTCTNIKNPKDQLLFKAYLVTLFIPDIAHPILLLKGVKGAAKSILETEVKRIIDPSEIDLLILNKKRNDFIINLAHNYYNAYDNVRKILDWLSSDICAATTGTRI